ncbi:MAG TPA: hypothetical protein VFB07_10920 [Vicinamibacterales bacterium]|nr:hypothetical protein [Vicinamibacterales bacterium]
MSRREKIAHAIAAPITPIPASTATFAVLSGAPMTSAVGSKKWKGDTALIARAGSHARPT